MSVSVTYDFNVTVKETLTTGVAGSSNPVVLFNAYNESGTIKATSTVPATCHTQFLMTLSAGAYTIDLTTLTGANGTFSATGLKLQILRIKNLGANFMTFAQGASNGYVFLASSWTIKVWPGGIYQFYAADQAGDVDGTHKTIDVVGTTTQTAEISMVFG